jgi:hypothetical protein
MLSQEQAKQIAVQYAKFEMAWEDAECVMVKADPTYPDATLVLMDSWEKGQEQGEARWVMRIADEFKVVTDDSLELADFDPYAKRSR